MSAILNFFNADPQWGDDLHKMISKIPGYEAELLPIRQAMLATCGAQASKSGKVELVVLDTKRWDALAAQQTAITGKIEAINRMVETVDAIFAEIDAAGIECTEKTMRGIVGVDMSRRTPVRDPDTGTDVDRFGHKIPSKHDPRALGWLQRAEKAIAEAVQA